MQLKFIVTITLGILNSWAFTSISPKQHAHLYIQQCRSKNNSERTIRLMGKFTNEQGALIGIPTIIGTAICHYNPVLQKGTLELLRIKPSYQNKGLGNILFKHVMASFVNSAPLKAIEWYASPLDNRELGALVGFYQAMGAIPIEQLLHDFHMKYEPKGAHIVSALLPVFEPTIQYKHKKPANDIIGTIVQYACEEATTKHHAPI
jgi:hypothetical protein